MIYKYRQLVFPILVQMYFNGYSTYFLNKNTENFNLVNNLWKNDFRYNSYLHENNEIEII